MDVNLPSYLYKYHPLSKEFEELVVSNGAERKKMDLMRLKTCCGTTRFTFQNLTISMIHLNLKAYESAFPKKRKKI